METKKIDKDYIESLLKKLIDEYHINENIISNLLEIETEKLKSYKKYEKEFTVDLDIWSKWINFVLQLEYIIDVDSDFRLRGILSLLINVYEINIEFIARTAHIEEKYLIDFINGEDYLSTEIKYKICATVMSLSLLFKNTEK
ncbi:TPA: HTH domain-containing protein [Clostridioides difficile]